MSYDHKPPIISASLVRKLAGEGKKPLEIARRLRLSYDAVIMMLPNNIDYRNVL